MDRALFSNLGSFRISPGFTAKDENEKNCDEDEVEFPGPPACVRQDVENCRFNRPNEQLVHDGSLPGRVRGLMTQKKL